MSLSRKNSEDDIIEYKNPLFSMRKQNNVKIGKKISDMFSDDEVTSLVQNLQARSQLQDPGKEPAPSVPRSSSPSSGTSSPPSPLKRISMKFMHRKSLDMDMSLLRVNSAPSKSERTKRRSSVDISHLSFRYDRTNSDSELPHFPKNSSMTTENGELSFTFSSSPDGSSSSTAQFYSAPYPLRTSEGCLTQLEDLSKQCNITYTEEKRKVLASATLDQLVFLLAGETVPDKDFIAQFLRTHHRFVDSKDFLHKLIGRYNLPLPPNLSEEAFLSKKKIVQVRVINVIKKWIELQLSDFHGDDELVLMLQIFIQDLMKAGGTEAVWADNLKIALLHSEDEINPTNITLDPEELPKPILPKNMIARYMQFLDIDPLELARQMTLIESNSLCNIQPKEYMHKRWYGSEKEKLAPNIIQIIERFNKVSYWVASEIVRQPDVQLRVKLLSKFIKLIKYLQELRNFQGVMAVYSALNMSPIQRLQETWKLLPNKYVSIYKAAEELMSSSQNFKNYRDTVRNCNPPLIPFQGVYLTDLTFLEEAPDFLENGAINFRKMGLIGDLLNEIHKFQTTKHLLSPVLPIQDFLAICCSSPSILDDVQLYSISKTIEPRKEI